MAIAAGVVGNLLLSAIATLPYVASQDASPAIDEISNHLVLNRA